MQCPVARPPLFYAVLIAVASLAVGMVLASRLDLSPRSEAVDADPPGRRQRAGHRCHRRPDVPQHRQDRDAHRRQHPDDVEARGRRTCRTSSAAQDDPFGRFFGLPQPRGPPAARGGRRRRRARASSSARTATSSRTTTSSRARRRSRSRSSATRTDEVYQAKIVGRDQLTDSALIQLTEMPKHAAAGGEARRLDADGAGRLGDGDRQPVRPRPHRQRRRHQRHRPAVAGGRAAVAGRASRPTRPSTRATRAGRC